MIIAKTLMRKMKFGKDDGYICSKQMKRRMMKMEMEMRVKKRAN